MRMTHLFRFACAFFFTALWFACVSMSQTETATVSGLITDETGAVVPGVEVKLQSVDRGTTTTATTNDAGIYVFASVQPGQYQVMVHKPGFKQVDLLGMIVNVQDHIEQNFRLQIGSVAESVTVNANDLKINTTDATISTVVDRQFAENLPMNGRSFQTLIQLTPGVVLTPSNNFDGGQFSVNGQRATSNYWMVDGVSANIGISASVAGSPGNGIGGALGSFSALGGTNSLVSVDALQEFRIQTSTYAPEFGRTPGGQISIVTRSGTNQFHGTAFDYLRNDKLDANDWFANFDKLRKPEERQNDFGGTFNGPILKDRTFFFFSYEGLRLRLPQTTLTTVPCDSTCTAFGNTRTMATSAMQPFLNAYPLPNGPEVFTPCTPNVNGCPASGQQPTGSAQFNASYSNPATLDAYSLRIDHKLGNKWTLFGRYNYSPSSLSQRAGGIYSASTDNVTSITTQTATLGATWVISASKANDLRFNYSRTSATSHYDMDVFGGAVPLTSLPFPSSFTSENGLLFFNLRSLTHGAMYEGVIDDNLQRQINIVDGLSMQEGSHSLKFGLDFRRLSPQWKPPAYFQVAQFRSAASAENGSLLAGSVSSRLSATVLFRNMGIYVQDSWRIVPRLTLTYGLRWDVDFVPSSLNGPNFAAVTGFNLNNLSNLSLAPVGTSPYQTTYSNVAPRLGVAYQLAQSQNWQTVLRGGFGVFYDLASPAAGNEGFLAYPFTAANLLFGGAYPYSPARAAPPPVTTAELSSFCCGTFFDPHLQLPYTLQWNVTWEQAIGARQALSISYIGSVGRRLIQTANVNSPNANITAESSFVTNDATSDYNGLQAQFKKRLSHGFQAIGSYTWSHSIDTASAGSAFGNLSNAAVAGINPNANRGPSDFDIRHAFSAGITYDVPAPKINAFTDALLRGWSTENFILARSAPPVDISDANFFQLNGSLAVVRPDVVAGQSFYLYGPGNPGGKAFNPATFTDPPTTPAGCNPAVDFPCNAARQGNLGRNFLRGFGATQWDFAVHRDFPVREAFKLQFRAEMFNVLNHPNFGQPNGTWPFGGFGLSSQMLGQSLNNNNLGGGAFSPLYQIGGPRSIQVALKLMF